MTLNKMIPEISEKHSDLVNLCRHFGVQRLEIFGSASMGGFRGDDSDLDFLVEFDTASPGYADRYFGLLESLQELFDRPVDLVVPSAITNPYFRESVERSKTLLYAA